MKKALSIALAVLMLLGCLSITAFADNGGATVYVSVANKGKLVAAQTKVTVSDIDGDGRLTVNDALYCAHEKVYSGGADAGYSYYIHKDYGLSVGKLWGDTSGNFGYYLNNKSCWSLSDGVKDGDYLNAFVYADGKYYSDTYCFFDAYTVSADAESDIELTLSCAGYDASWNPVTLPLADAEITVDGQPTGIRTDSNGKATITISDSGSHIISAVSASKTLVPPVCTAEIQGGFFANIISGILSFFRTIIDYILSFFA